LLAAQNATIGFIILVVNNKCKQSLTNNVWFLFTRCQHVFRHKYSKTHWK